MSEDRKAYNKAEAAKALGVSEKTIDRLIARGDLPVVYLTSRPSILASSLDELLANAPTEKKKAS